MCTILHNSKLNPLQYKLIGFLASLIRKKSLTFEQASLIVIDLAKNVHFTSTGDSNVDFFSCWWTRSVVFFGFLSTKPSGEAPSTPDS